MPSDASRHVATRTDGERAAASVELPQAAGIVASVSASGASYDVGGARFSTRTRSVSRVGTTRAPGPAELLHADHGARLVHGAGVEEWWVTAARGVEHGYRLASAPAGRGEVRIELAIDGDLEPRLRASGVDFVDGGGTALARYDHLAVVDADGAAVPSSLTVEGRVVALHLDDSHARYPVVVDPLMYALVDRLEEVPTSSGLRFGNAVAVSADGTRIVVTQTSSSSTTAAGAAFVFMRSGGTYVLEQRIDPTPGSDADNFGTSAALDATGTRLAVGAQFNTAGSVTNRGAVYVFARSGTTWTQEGLLVASDDADDDNLGSSVAITSDGSRVISGAIAKDLGGGTVDAGAAYVFGRVGTTWSQQQRLVASDASASGFFGRSVAVAPDGTRLVVGATGALNGATTTGAAYVFLWTGSAYAQEQKLLATVPVAAMRFGASVAFDGTATRAVVGAPNETGGAGLADRGGAYVFLRTGTTWAQESRQLGSLSGLQDQYGADVRFDTTGSRLLVGASADEPAAATVQSTGVVYVLTRTGTTWSEAQILAPPDGVQFASFGSKLAVDTTTNVALVGAPVQTIVAPTVIGAAYVYELGGTGASCTGAGDCDSGFCVDGVCCATACGGGATNDCMACSAALTGGDDGICAALSSVAAPTITCRGAAGTCDVAETCVAGSMACPGDVLLPSSSTCRPSAGSCDVAERCDGLSAACPADGFQTGTVCRASGGACDVEETCSGTGAACPADAKVASGSECRPSGGGCDVAEVCNGTDNACPGDQRAAVGTLCRPPVSLCDTAEFCTGAVACPADLAAPSGTTCRASAGTCDLVEVCDGSSTTCPADSFRPSSTLCRASVGTCDSADFCSGTAADCPDVRAAENAPCDDGQACTSADACVAGSCVGTTSPAGTVCRGATGSCDVAEVCNGSSGACPADGFVASGTVCRATAGGCDVAEVCDGANAACPGDTTLPPGTVCRASTGVCDAAESCTGAAACPADVAGNVGVVCRPSAGLCDVAETCDGVATTCPTNGFQAALVSCRPALSPCDFEDFCTGSSASCPDATRADGDPCDDGLGCTTLDACSAGICAGTTAPLGTVCRAAAGTCDAVERCDGATTACPPDDFRASGTTCRASAGGCDVAEVCSGGSAACPGDTRLPTGTVCRASIGLCDAEESCDGSAACPPDLGGNAGVVCRAANGLCDLAEACDGVATACPSDGFAPTTTLCRAAVSACDRDDFCSGTGGSCPDVTIGDGEACDDGLGCTGGDACQGGLCEGSVLAAGTTCRGAAGACDVAEACDGASPSCPSDTFASSGTTCRASGGGCDVAEVCNGATAACPGDVRLPVGTVCRASVDACDVPESCDGGPACPVDLAAEAGTICRASGGLCDTAEVCNGSASRCPDDVVAAAGTVCRGASGPCDVEDVCDGTTGLCADAVRADGAPCVDGLGCTLADTCNGGVCAGTLASAGTVCRGAAGGCDVPESCDGSSSACPIDLRVPSGTTCRAAAGGCDVDEVCDGSATECPGDARLPVGTPCRVARGVCDLAEACDGSPACPADARAAAGTVCQPARGVCDVAEACSGADDDCPADEVAADGTPCDDGLTCTQSSICAVGACSPERQIDCSDGDPCTTDLCAEPVGCRHDLVPACLMPDAGAEDAGAGADAATTSDGGADAGDPRLYASGCACRAAASTRPRTTPWALLAGLLVAVRRRRTRRAPGLAPDRHFGYIPEPSRTHSSAG